MQKRKSTGRGPRGVKAAPARRKGASAARGARPAKKAAPSSPRTWGAIPVFRALGGDGFATLVKRLLAAERFASGVAIEQLTVSEQGNRGDQGVDAYLSVTPPRPTDLLRAPSVFQFKLSYKGRAAVVAEVKTSPRLQQLLRDGAWYVLVVGGDADPLTAKAESAELEAQISALVNRKTTAVVVPAPLLLELLRQHSALWRYVPDAPRVAQELWTFTDWESRENAAQARMPWTPDEARSEALNRIVSAVRTQGVVRVSGRPGVGKTRLVLEAVRALASEGGPSAVAYLRKFDDGAIQLLNPFGTAIKGILVVDECSRDQHLSLAGARKPPLSLITIGGSDSEDASSEPDRDTIWLGSLEPAAMEALARATGGTIPPANRVAVAERCGGYPKLLRLSLDALEQAGATVSEQLNLDRASLAALLERYLATKANSTDLAVQVLTLPSHLEDSDYGVLANVAGCSELQLRAIRDVLERLALTGQLPGNRSYITPILLGDWLAERCWRNKECVLLRALTGGNASAGLIQRCLRRLVNGGERCKEVIGKLFSGCRDELQRSVGPEDLDRLLLTLANSDPFSALSAIVALEANAGQSWRPALGLALARCAWEPELFSQSASLLARLESHRAEGSRGPSDTASLFGAHLGLTKAGATTRLATLESMARGTDPRLRALAVRCARRACEIDSGAWVRNPSIDVRQAWRPADAGEERDYRARAACVLIALFNDGDTKVRQASFEAAVRVVRDLVSSGFADVAASLVREYLAAGGDLVAMRRIYATVEQFDLAKLPARAGEIWRELRPNLRPRTLGDRVRAITFPSATDPDPEEVRAVAREFVSSPSPELLDSLFGAGAVTPYGLGLEVGRADVERRLVNEIITRSAKASNLAFAAGYLLGLGEPPSTQDLLDELASRPELARLAFEATRALPTERGAERMIRMVRQGFLDSGELGMLVLGGWLLHVNAPMARRVIEAAAGTPAAAFRLAFQVANAHPAKDELLDLLLATWRRVEPWNRLEWEWEQSARLLMSQDLDAVMTRTLELVMKRVEQAEVLSAEFLGVLSQLAERAPERVARALAERLETLGPDDALRLSLTLRRSRLAESLTPQLMLWAGQEVERGRLLANLVVTVTESNLGGQLLARFPDDRRIDATLRAALHSGQFHSESSFAQLRLTELQALSRSPNRCVASWARRVIPEFERMRKRALQVESAYEAGVLPLPLLGEGHSRND